MSSMSEKDGFANFDDLEVYKDSCNRALRRDTRNFVVEFGKDEAQIAFDLEADDMEQLLTAERVTERPVRWINIWAPNRQTNLVELIGKHYKFSPRLLAIIISTPPEVDEPPRHSRHDGGVMSRMKVYRKDDVESRASKVEINRPVSAARSKTHQMNASHYDIAKQMVHYQSVDNGAKFLCIGANWMHETSKANSKYAGLTSGLAQQRLWSWLVLGDDHTVISLHEDPGSIDIEADVEIIRANTISVLSQLSKCGHDSADPLSIQTVRQTLELEATEGDAGVGGASNLFYYLFDDWRAVYKTVAMFQQRLTELGDSIISDNDRKSTRQANTEITPRLHQMGRNIRQMEHLYKGYRNLISRIIEQKPVSDHGMSISRAPTGLGTKKDGVVFAKSAIHRFQRLGDRIQLLILSQTQEFLAEKDALNSTYFNIVAQKDSEATARLTRAATVLAKLSVLFLPVSLMTGYFSVQIKDLEGRYTTKDYWVSFAVIMGISVLGLFFFAKSLMWITETLDAKAKQAWKACKAAYKRRFSSKLGPKHADEEDGKER